MSVAADSVDRVVEDLLRESMTSRVTVSRPLPEFNEDAFEVALNVFHLTRSRALDGIPHSQRDAQAFAEADREGLLAFLASYEEIVS